MTDQTEQSRPPMTRLLLVLVPLAVMLGAFVWIASLDPLRDQGRAYAAKLVETGVPTVYYEGHGLIHGFATFRKDIPSAQNDTVAFLKLARTMLDEIEADSK